MSKSLNGKGLGTPLLAASKFSSEEIKVSEDSLPHSGGSFLHERDVLPKHNLQETSLDQVISRSILANENPVVQSQNVVREFNKNVRTSAFTTSLVRGRRINRDEYLLGHRNRIAELAPFSPNLIAGCITNPNTVLKVIGTYKQNDLFFGCHGSFVLNVPRGRYAKIWLGQTPKLLDQGPHVIHDPNLRFDVASGFVQMSGQQISHGTITILRIPVGKIARVWLGTTPMLLYARADGRPFVVDDPLFRFDSFVSQTESYIGHGTIHILRIPSGKVAKVWIGSEAKLLESRLEPYEFHSPYFRMERRNVNELFEVSTSKLIVHGSLKRLIPSTGEVAIGYRNGNLEIIPPSGGSKPIVIDSETFKVEGFLSTGIQTLVFPSEEMRNQRKKENKNASDDEINYEIFTTKDSLKVGVKLLVAYKVVDPSNALAVLGKEGIVPHIENCATVDMGKAIQQCSSQEFLTSNQTKPRKTGEASSQVAAPLFQHFQDVVKNELMHDLSEYGIELVRLNFETPKVLDQRIAAEMASQSLLTAQVSAKEAVLDQNYKIARTEAQQKAEVQRITQDQVNANTLNAARAELEAAKLRAEATVIQAQAKKRAMDLVGLQYRDHPSLLDLEKLRILTKPLSDAKLNVVVSPEDLRSFLLTSLNPAAGGLGALSLFGGGALSSMVGADAESAQAGQEEQKAEP